MPDYLHWDSCSGDQGNNHGYPRVNQVMRRAFKRIGVDIDSPAQTYIYHGPVWPVRDLWSGRRNGIFSMWESSALSYQQIATLQFLDFAIAPSRHSAELFKPWVKEQNVLVTPHGVEGDVYKPERRTSGQGPYRVFCNAENGRKSWSEVGQGFLLAALPDSEIVFKGKDAEKAAQVVAEGGGRAIALVEYVTEPELADLYRSMDVLVAANRAEGWDMVAFEALACGTPLIAPNHTAYLDWNHLANRILRKHRMEPWCPCEYGNVGPWYAPDPEEIAQALWDVYNDSAALSRAEASSQIVRSYTWDDCARDIVDFLAPLEPLHDKGECIDWKPELWVRGKLSQNWDVGGSKGSIRQGERRRVWLEEARVLQDAGVAVLDDVQDWSESGVEVAV